MTNFEWLMSYENRDKFKDILKELLCKGRLAFDEETDSISSCDNIPCYQCAFQPESFDKSCITNKKRWLNRDHNAIEKKVKDLTKHEINNIHNNYKSKKCKDCPLAFGKVEYGCLLETKGNVCGLMEKLEEYIEVKIEKEE